MHRSELHLAVGARSELRGPARRGGWRPRAKTKPSVPKCCRILADQQVMTFGLAFWKQLLPGAGLRRDTAVSGSNRRCNMQTPQIAWGLAGVSRHNPATFFQWGDDDRGRFKAFAMGSMQQRCATVVLTNGFHGMAICRS